MRDILLTAFIGAALMLTFRYPFVGAYLWAWLSLMNPHKLTYGFAFNFPFAQAAAVATLVALAYSRERRPLPMSSVLVLQVLLLVWMSFTSLFALAEPAVVQERWIFVMKIQVMLLVTWMLITDPKKLRGLIWVVTLSVAFYGVKGGAFTLLTGGSQRVWGPPGGMLEENNALAVALVMLLPMMYFLRETEPRKWVRSGLLVMMVLCAFSILGSQSRGALLAALAMTFFLGLKGKHPIRSTVLLTAFAFSVIAFMPESWTDRMDTMRTYEQDGSAMARVWSWHTHWNAAVDRPLVGVGFEAANDQVFARYAPTTGEYAMFRGKVWVAHSIYFQTLGEHGFVGLGLFLLLGVQTWRLAGRRAREAIREAEFEKWVPILMRMTQVSLIGFAVGGGFLSLANHDLPYYIVGFVIATDGIMRRRTKELRDTAVQPQAIRPPLVETAVPRNEGSR
jgi:putative inorganic carbon (HCO3(-)) transporter